MKYFLFLLSAIYYLLSTAPSANAGSEFSTNFTSSYTITRLGDAKVTHTITLKNNLAHIYATNYTLAVSGDTLENLITSDESGPLTHNTSSQNGVTNIHLQITNPAIGKDQEKKLLISYAVHDVVERLANTTTINIPRLAKANEAESYTRTVRIEGIEDSKALISPPPSTTQPDGDYVIYTWNGYGNESLTMLFGESVTYRLNLTYELKNKELGQIDSELALPPDTAYQRIILGTLNPEPSTIRVDSSGNWLARYSLKAQEKLLVNAEVYATVYPVPTSYDPSVKTFQKTPHSLYWDVSSSSVQALGEKLKSPQNIYKYLTDNFIYNYSGLTPQSKRHGATTALTLSEGVLCTEFTDTFVALARVNQIPSREINGYGFTKNTTLQPIRSESDILHAWPEYYDSLTKQWISVDPTWGNTTGGVDYFSKLDFSHITFVRHGEEDSYPLPAGAYKSNSSDKHIQVEIAPEVPQANPRLEQIGNTLYNRGNVAVINDTVGYLPPYASFTLNDHSSPPRSLYDKIKALCVSLLSKFWRQPPASI